MTQDMVDKLKPGMTKSQVRFVLGTPLIVDAFRDNRWDYVYMRQEKGELIEQESLTIFFENEILTHFENHLLSSGNADVVESREFYSEKVESPEESVNNQD